MRLTLRLECVVAFTATLAVVPGAALANTGSQKVTDRSAATTLNDGSAAEQAFIFDGLTMGEDLRHWQTGKGLRSTLEAATGPGGYRLRVSLAKNPSPERGTPGVIYIGQSTRSQLDLATYTSAHRELQIIVPHTPVLS